MSLPLPFFLDVVESDALLMRCLQDRLSSATKRMRGLCLSSFEEIDPEGVVLGVFDLISLWSPDEMVRLDVIWCFLSIHCLRTRSRLES